MFLSTLPVGSSRQRIIINNYTQVATPMDRLATYVRGNDIRCPLEKDEKMSMCISLGYRSAV